MPSITIGYLDRPGLRGKMGTSGARNGILQAIRSDRAASGSGHQELSRPPGLDRSRCHRAPSDRRAHGRERAVAGPPARHAAGVVFQADRSRRQRWHALCCDGGAALPAFGRVADRPGEGAAKTNKGDAGKSMADSLDGGNGLAAATLQPSSGTALGPPSIGNRPPSIRDRRPVQARRIYTGLSAAALDRGIPPSVVAAGAARCGSRRRENQDSQPAAIAAQRHVPGAGGAAHDGAFRCSPGSGRVYADVPAGRAPAQRAA